MGFQTDKLLEQEKNTSIFNHTDLKNIYVNLNNTRYPKANYNLSFSQNQFSTAYGNAIDFKSKFYRMDDSYSILHKSIYKDLYPLFVFDVSNQSERIKYSITDITVNAVFNFLKSPTGTLCFSDFRQYALVTSDKILNFNQTEISVMIG